MQKVAVKLCTWPFWVYGHFLLLAGGRSFLDTCSVPRNDKWLGRLYNPSPECGCRDGTGANATIQMWQKPADQLQLRCFKDNFTMKEFLLKSSTRWLVSSSNGLASRIDGTRSISLGLDSLNILKTLCARKTDRNADNS